VRSIGVRFFSTKQAIECCHDVLLCNRIVLAIPQMPSMVHHSIFESWAEIACFLSFRRSALCLKSGTIEVGTESLLRSTEQIAGRFGLQPETEEHHEPDRIPESCIRTLHKHLVDPFTQTHIHNAMANGHAYACNTCNTYMYPDVHPCMHTYTRIDMYLDVHRHTYMMTWVVDTLAHAHAYTHPPHACVHLHTQHNDGWVVA
jgi:hypothetical protein